jgi:hypothetical protein
MAWKALKPDVTIRDVVSTLADKEEYTRVVLEHLMACQSKHGKGNAHVRIGITGTGQFPSHKVIYDDPEGVETLFDAYAERTRFTENIQVHTWSTERMSVDEVRSLLGERRGFKQAVPKNA